MMEYLKGLHIGDIIWDSELRQRETILDVKDISGKEVYRLSSDKNNWMIVYSYLPEKRYYLLIEGKKPKKYKLRWHLK